ncbi:hypothetical protein LIX60_17240 [Streptomyces sp. S07_1.15]|uniref:hypothetical protein n=1 Tax=Streptomyces sp. S07_1.15 TaxID=2873925 RepID=UPI001D1539A1|nr:hypothetical protein [Streptomyces sp. S07_1.15]MCC3653174.1 hypothetical protein [Streptomyces sp. S07_1.15]
MDGVAAAREGFQEAERKAANTINAIGPAMCRPKWVEDDGSHQPGMYGQSAEMLKGVEDLPWGSPEGRTYERWSLEWWGHGAKSWVWDGIVVDSIWGGVEGIGTLLGYDGAEAAGQAWDGLRRTFVGAYAYGMDWAGRPRGWHTGRNDTAWRCHPARCPAGHRPQSLQQGGQPLRPGVLRSAEAGPGSGSSRRTRPREDARCGPAESPPHPAEGPLWGSCCRAAQ